MSDTAPSKRVVILGGGFGGVYTARHLERLWTGRRDVEIILVSRHNYFLMTPLLFEAGSGVLEPRHAVSPIRKLYTKVRCVQAEVEGVDFETKTVRCSPSGRPAPWGLKYDHLVIALGGVTNTSVIPGAEHAMTFKVLADAIYLRNHLIELFEKADVETNAARKKTLLTFVIAGAGLVGVELVGELTEFFSNLAGSYPRIDQKEIQIELLEGGPNVMPEMDRDLADYAVNVLRRRGVNVRTNARASRMEPERIYLQSGESIDAATIIVATGVKPSPLLASFPLEKDNKGRLLTAATMLCAGRKDVWAIGDCAHIPDPQGKPYPQLAQHALREAKVLAGNIHAALHGGTPQPFIYKTMGTLAALGHFAGVGRAGKFKFKGFLAWWIWRSYYLLQMPRWNRRFRIVLDWTVALLFKNDIVELDLFGDQHPLDRDRKPPEKLTDSPLEYIGDMPR